MSYMFDDCNKLPTLDVSGFDTSNVTTMSHMFSFCKGLRSLDLSGFDTSNVTDMSSMFSMSDVKGSSQLESLNLSGFDTSNVTDMSSMFYFCGALRTLDVSGFDTSAVTDMSYMFVQCKSLTNVGVSGFDTSNVTDMRCMFSGCSKLANLDVTGFNTSAVTDMSYMFKECSGLKTLDLSGFNASNVTGMDSMFSDCSNLLVLKTPFNVHITTDLPDTYVDASGTEYNTLPQGLSKSIRLTKKGADIPDEPETIADAAVMGITNKTYTGTAQTQNPTVKLGGKTLAAGTDYTLSYANNTNAGTATVTITGKGNYTGTISKTFIISAASISGATVTGITNRTYTGTAQTQDPIVTLGDKTLTAGTDYTLSYSNNTNIGTATVTITGKGNYTGTISKTFTISAASISGATVTGLSNKTYSGTAQTQNPTVRMGGKTLSAGADYTLSYANNMNAGTATVIITGKGNYTGSISKTFTISKATPTLTFSSTSISKTTQDAAFTNALTKTTDGTVTFSSSNTSVAVVNNTSGMVTIKGSGTTTITATAAEGVNYNTGSTQYTLTVTKVLNILNISDDFYGKTGTQASFHIEAEGPGIISYQWQYRAAGTTDWKTPSQVSAKTTDYVFNLKQSYDNIEVRCIVSDESGNELISETRKANVFAYTSQPKDAVASEGQVVKFKVSAIGRGVTYQWYFKRPNSTWKKTTVSGSNTAILPITAGTKNDGTSYRCVITDEEGNQITSAAGTLTMQIPLQITGVSENVYDRNGESVTFHIDAVGQGALSYQWQYRLAGESNWRTPGQASAKTADYVFKLKPSYDNIEVRCIVTDASGDTCTSDVRKANVFAITQQPNTVFAELGDKVTFAVEGIGQNLSYQWYYRRLDGDWNKVTAAGYNTASLTITAQVKNNGSQYRCYVYDGFGNLIKSRAAMLIERNEEYEG